jgi:dTDP-4-dehydrorhamnose 3,5-epimerase
MNIEDTELPGLKIVRPIVRPDNRGYFVKTFQKSIFENAGLQTNYTETFFSQSKKDVVRGLHFQTPPAAQDKFVFCASGSVTDFVVDIRKGSPTYGRHLSFDLNAEEWTALFIPIGFAHGFVARTDAVMGYFCSAEFDPATDSGVLWNSAGIDWQVDDPIISEKDQHLTALDEYQSPFTF